MNAEDVSRKNAAISILTDQYLDMCKTRHGNTATCKAKASKLYTVANEIPKLKTKLAEVQEAYEQLSDGRTYGEMMKQLSFDVFRNHATGSVESTHTAVFTALSASTDESIDLMKKALFASLPDGEKREFASSRGLTDLDEVVDAMTNDYVNYHISCVEMSCKMLKLKMKM